MSKCTISYSLFTNLIKYSQTSEARTRESSNTTENLTKNLGPDKNDLNSMSSTSEKSHTVKLEFSSAFHGPKCTITILLPGKGRTKGWLID